MKTCKHCNRTLPEDQFYTGSSWCKGCKKDYARRYREQHPEKHKEYQLRFREQLRENIDVPVSVAERFERDEEGLIKCKQCGIFKTDDEFYKTYGVYIRMPCKQCMKENRARSDQEEV